jgi:sensor histidine kinase YesM
MFTPIFKWHRAWEDEILEVLKNPAHIASVAPGYRRHTAQRLLKLSSIERQQVYEFSVKYRGAKGYLALGKLVAWFCLPGLALHFALPAKFGVVEAVVLSNLLGLATAFGLVSVWFNYRRIPQPSVKSFLLIIALSSAGALMGASAVAMIEGKSLAFVLENISRTVLIGGVGAGTVYAVIYGAVSVWRNREFEMQTNALQMQAEQDRLARQLSESRLRLLQAQIEPHFLFNTLGAVQQLAQHESPRAADLTANLITFLRASLGDMRTEQVSLQAELNLVEAYLKVMKTRLAHRLKFDLQLPPNLAQLTVPGMLVLTLVENAIKHGIEPALQGGRIDVTVHADEHSLTIEVRDTGAGQTIPTVLGVGLSNLKERIALAYGTLGQLELQACEPTGMLASLHLPISRMGRAA